MENRTSQQASEELIRIREEKCKVLHEVRTTVRDCMNANKGVFRLVRSDHNGFAQFYSFGAQLLSGSRGYNLHAAFTIRDDSYEECIYLSDNSSLYLRDFKAYHLTITAGNSINQELDRLSKIEEDTSLFAERFFSRFSFAGVIHDPRNGNMEYTDMYPDTSMEPEECLYIVQTTCIERLPNAPLTTYRQFLREVGDPFDHGQILRSMKPFN